MLLYDFSTTMLGACLGFLIILLLLRLVFDVAPQKDYTPDEEEETEHLREMCKYTPKNWRIP